MKAFVSNKYGSPDVLELQDVEKPVCHDNQVLVKVHASSINYGNIVLLRGKPFLARFAFGITKPKYKIPGGDIAGIVEAVGNKVTHFKIGDEVFGDLSSSGWGGFAEYVTVPENAIALKPKNISFEEAAALPMASTTALQALRNKGAIQEGQKVLIYGASGGVGTFAVQIAKALGANVTAVCSTRNVDIIKSLGIDHVIDYKKETIFEKDNTYDLILGVNGYQPISVYLKALKANGKFILVGGSQKQMPQAMFRSIGNKKINIFLQSHKQEDLNFINELVEKNQLTAVIDRSFSFKELPNAVKYFEEGHAQGKVVVTI
ncbi:NAD(P)-dependent alcohol dehydrogenase [Bacillus sp. DTU_2020_1000418_1_SI_GHA_SEK_038]|uniref:NAD(P)-dependent alcohol dehydrogenase n=1 Tax=Bacillus sp. DTU_2020_1000418_1_SI_GHA_SEK_038 TaxID=3077585 RepID=UPI0028EAE435|nr:NAD(P)-dependent alcohol dehydrogenase [Bacillus sp. DTU_2020_1000418_1_SI_GHA_SEK_038]WNS73733.1 NAD(P)-dependent alcohol dehydrogenase [Bacillus sp. DTU_2020_1000418_1_SI_GHA_SEK_038]